MNPTVYMSRNRGLIFRILLYTFLSIVFISLVPVLTKLLIDSYRHFSGGDILRCALGYIGAIGLFLFFEWKKKCSHVEFAKIFGISIKRDLFEACTKMRHDKLNEKGVGDLINAMVNDTDTIYETYIHCRIDLMMSVLSFVVYLIYMLWLSRSLALIAVTACFLSFFIPRVVGKRMDQKRKALSDARSTMMEALSDLAECSELFGDERSSLFAERFDRYNVGYESRGAELGKYVSFTQIFSGFSLYFINITTFVFGLILVCLSQIEISSLIAMLGFVDLVAIPTRDIIYQFITLRSAKEVIGKLDFYFENREEEKAAPPADFSVLRVSHLNYSLGAFSFRDLNLTFEKGKKYALVGENGCGKSTLIKLLAGERETPAGTVFLDEADVCTMNRRRLFYFCSKPAIFKGSLTENIQVGNPALAPPASALRVTEQAEDKEIDFLGKNLSLGQRAKISVARALHAGQPILILDEIFANSDEQSERELTKQLLQSEKTLLLVTHNRDDHYLAQFDAVCRL